MIVYRRCCACGETKDRNSLIKITRAHDSKNLFVNPSTNIFGRSVYVCKNNDCVKNAFRKKRIFRFLKVSENKDVMDKILAVLDKE